MSSGYERYINKVVIIIIIIIIIKKNIRPKWVSYVVYII